MIEYMENINGDVAKIMETSANVIVMFDFTTKFFPTYNAAVQFLRRHGFRF